PFAKRMAVTRLSIGTGFLNDRVAFASPAESRNPRRLAAPEFSAPHETRAGLSTPRDDYLRGPGRKDISNGLHNPRSGVVWDSARYSRPHSPPTRAPSRFY